MANKEAVGWLAKHPKKKKKNKFDSPFAADQCAQNRQTERALSCACDSG